MARLAGAIFRPSEDAILARTGGRERAESLGHSAADVSPRLQPLLGRPSRRPSDPSGSASPREGIDDGEHGVVTAPPSRQRSINYQSTAEMSPATRRRSTQTRKRPGQEQGQPAPGANRAEDVTRAQPARPWWKRFFRYFMSIELENKGSVARDHLALERTFLAWLRTSLSFASIGIAVTQLFRLNTSLSGDSQQAESVRRLGKPLGATFLAVSILILLLGYNRYLQGQYWVIKGKFPASRGTIMAVSFIAFGVTLASLIVILAVQNEPQ